MRLVDGTKRAPEARIPRPWLTHKTVKGLSESSFRLWVLLWSYAHWETHTAFPSANRLKDEIGKSPRQLYRALSDLEQAGLLTRKKEPGRTTVYTLLAPGTQAPTIPQQ